MSKKWTRKELRSDALQTRIQNFTQWVEIKKEANPTQFWVWVSALIVLPMAAGFLLYSLHLKSLEAETRYLAAIENLGEGNVHMALSQLDTLDQEFSSITMPEAVPYFKATALFRNGKPAEALALYKEFIAKDSSHPLVPDAKYAQAQCHEELKEYDQAEAVYRAILKNNPDAYVTGAVRLSLAILLDEKGNEEEAVSLYKEVVKSRGDLEEGQRGFWYDQALYELEARGHDREALLQKLGIEPAASSEASEES